MLLASPSSGRADMEWPQKCGMCSKTEPAQLAGTGCATCRSPLCFACHETIERLGLRCFTCEQPMCTAPTCSVPCSSFGSCKGLYCYTCSKDMPECGYCWVPFCPAEGPPEKDCVVACQGDAGCQNVVCRLCAQGRNGCEVCQLPLCDNCRKTCKRSCFSSCTDCRRTFEFPEFCESCKASKCIVCLIRKRPCDKCHAPVEDKRLLQAMACLTESLERWARFDTREPSPGLPVQLEELPLYLRSPALRDQVVSVWKENMARMDRGQTQNTPSLPSAQAAAPIAAAAVAAKRPNQASSSDTKIDGGDGHIHTLIPTANPSITADTGESRSGGGDLGGRVPAVSAAVPHTATGGVAPAGKTPAGSSLPPPPGFQAALSTPATATEGARTPAEQYQEQQRSVSTAGRADGSVVPAAGARIAEPTSEAKPQAEPALAAAGTSTENARNAMPPSKDVDAVDFSAGMGSSSAHLDAHGRVPIDDVRRFVARVTGPFPTRVANVAEIKRMFTGWVEPSVVDICYEGTGKLADTVNFCVDVMKQQPAAEPRAAALADADASPDLPLDASGSLSVNTRAEVSADGGAADAEAKERNPPVLNNAGAAARGEMAQPQTSSGQQASAAAAAAAGAVGAADATATDSLAGGSTTHGLWAARGQASAEEEKTQMMPAARAEAEEAAQRREVEAREAEAAEAKAREHAEREERKKRAREAAEAKKAAGEKVKAEAVAEAEAKRIADERAEKEARRLRMQKAAEEERARREEAETARKLAEARAAAQTPNVRTDAGFLADQSLEQRMRLAMQRGSVIAVQAILDEAADIPGTAKIKKACKNWLAKNKGEQRKEEPPRKPDATARTAAAAGAKDNAAQKGFYEMFCPKHLVAQVIGKGGSMIQKLKRDSKAMIVIRERRTGGESDVLIAGRPRDVAVARRLIEQLYRDKGVDPSRLPATPTTAVSNVANALRVAASAAPTTGGGARARLPEQAPGGADAMVTRLAQAKPPAAPARAKTQVPGAAAGAGEVWGGELRALLKRADCEKHLNMFQDAMMDIESLTLMRPMDFQKMGVSQNEMSRIVKALRAPGEEEDSDDDLDPDDPTTCKICLDAKVEIMFIPCGHQSTCERCGGQFTGSPCIICRVPVQQTIKFYVA